MGEEIGAARKILNLICNSSEKKVNFDLFTQPQGTEGGMVGASAGKLFSTL